MLTSAIALTIQVSRLYRPRIECVQAFFIADSYRAKCIELFEDEHSIKAFLYLN